MAWRELTVAVSIGVCGSLAGCRFDPAGAPTVRMDAAVMSADAGDGATAIDAAPVMVDASAIPDAVVTPDAAVWLDAAPMPGESCAAPYDLGTLAVGVQRVLGRSTLGAAHDRFASCNGEIHPDHVYFFQVATPAKVTATVTPSGWNAAIESTTGFVCAAALPIECWQGSGEAVITTVQAYPANAYWIWIDGANAGGGAQAGDYMLTIDVSVL